MISVRELKLKKVFNLKEYLEEKVRLDKEYKEYVEQALKEAEEDIAAGRVYTEEEFLKELKKDMQEFELMQNE